MYFDYFRLKKNPFRITPDEGFIYLLGGHKRSYAYLKYTSWANDGFMLLTGEIGTGKTILLKKLSRDLGDQIKIVNISQTQMGLDDLLRIFLYELTGSFEGASRAELIIRIRESLLSRKRDNEKTLLILDEAQNLNKECLEEIRLLADEMYDGENILNVILAGQPEIESNIDIYGLEQLRQRIRIIYRLTALKESDVQGYVDFRTYIGYGLLPFSENEVAMLNGKIKQVDVPDHVRLFEEGVDEVVYRNTRGIPRLINALCETALVVAYGDRKNIVSIDIVNQAVDELGWLNVDDAQESHLIESGSLTDNGLKIEVSLDGEVLKAVNVKQLPFTIGRSDSNDLVLGNKTVSKKHAVLRAQNESLIISDCNSTNGVKINGLKVESHLVSNGEITQVGRYKLRFYVRNKQESPVDKESDSTLQIGT